MYDRVLNMTLSMYRSSRPEVFCKKGILRNFVKFTGKHQCESLFFRLFCRLNPATLLKKRLSQRCFLVNFAKFLKKTFSYRIPPVAASVCIDASLHSVYSI